LIFFLGWHDICVILALLLEGTSAYFLSKCAIPFLSALFFS
jgi:hypothetical protein